MKSDMLFCCCFQLTGVLRQTAGRQQGLAACDTWRLSTAVSRTDSGRGVRPNLWREGVVLLPLPVSQASEQFQQHVHVIKIVSNNEICVACWFELKSTVTGTVLRTTYWQTQAKLTTRSNDWTTDNLTNNKQLLNCDNRWIEMHQWPYPITSQLDWQITIASQINGPIRSKTRVWYYHHLM